ncbi:MAG: DNA repair protein RecN [Bacteroidota bacterium]|jgi:DNA repair protein RecN (Recombination protein N)
MLKTLSIKNYALIEDLAVEPGRGLNIMTGETGAGKSIIIDALSLILGERADSDTVRKGAEKAVVEGFLDVSDNKRLKHLLAAHEIESGDELILRREVSVKGQSRCFINDSPATITLLKQVGDLLVDLHGQHEHQSLLRPETHIDMLDDYGALGGLVSEFRGSYQRATSFLNRIAELRSKEQQLKERRSLYEFQINEIEAVNPRSGEEEELETELVILENAERLYSATERLYKILYESDNAVHDQIVLARNELEDLVAIDKSFEEPKNEATSAAAIVSELAKFIQRYNSKVEFNPVRLEEIRTRLGQLALLKKKYGGSLETVLRRREEIGREIALADNFEGEIETLQQQFMDEQSVCSEIAQRLSAKRHEAAKKVDKAVVQSLGELGIQNARFETRITRRVAGGEEPAVVRTGKQEYEATPKGIDTVEFYVSTNVGEDLKPLAKVASGGEISRIMLALKMNLAKSDRLPLLVFDEIDVGVSGRIAQAVGQSLKKLSQFHQVISITHLPQIAGFADTHFVVEKMERGNPSGKSSAAEKQVTGRRATTRMRKLNLEERVVEVARLMSGEDVTKAGLQGARELMGIEGK